jgi:8-oxo-dGTP diphosphatase
VAKAIPFFLRHAGLRLGYLRFYLHLDLDFPSKPSNRFVVMIRVTCAIIVDASGKVLATQRSATMSEPLKWEFPGGKIEDDETPAMTIVREIREELHLDIDIVLRGPSSVRRRDDGEIIELIPFVSRIASGNLQLQEHRDARWLSPEQLGALDWSEPDIPILQWWLAGTPNA